MNTKYTKHLIIDDEDIKKIDILIEDKEKIGLYNIKRTTLYKNNIQAIIAYIKILINDYPLLSKILIIAFIVLIFSYISLFLMKYITFNF